MLFQFFFFIAEIIVGYVHTIVAVLESDRVAQLTVAISMPPEADPIEMSFFLMVMTTLDQTATGLSWRLGFDFLYHYTPLILKHCHKIFWCTTYTHTHTHTHTHTDIPQS